MTKENPNQDLRNEIVVGFHFIRKSANALVEDLKYFNRVPNHFTDQQVSNILGQLEEVEQNIQNVRSIFSRKSLG